VNGARPYGGPYVAGIGVGLTLLASFLVLGRGLGTSGAFTSVVAAGVYAVAPPRRTERDVLRLLRDSGEVAPLRPVGLRGLGVIVGGSSPPAGRETQGSR